MIQEKHTYDDYGTHYPNSRKVYVTGSRPDIRVPFREIQLCGNNENLRLYDVSGSYADVSVEIDLKQGLPAIRSAWIADRKDVGEHLSGIEILSNTDKAFKGLARRPLRANKESP